MGRITKTKNKKAAVESVDLNIAFERAIRAAAEPGRKLMVPEWDFLQVRQRKGTGSITVYFHKHGEDPVRLGRLEYHSTDSILKKYQNALDQVKRGKTVNLEPEANLEGLSPKSRFYDVAMKAIKHKEAGTCRPWGDKVCDKYAYQMKRNLINHMKSAHDIPVNQIEHEDIAKIIEAVMIKSPKGNLANNCRNVFTAVLEYASFQWKGRVANLKDVDVPRIQVQYEEHAGFSTQEDVALVDELLDKKPKIPGLTWTVPRKVSADVLRLMMHYGGRGIAIRNMKKEWVDLKNRKVVFPEDVMKIGEELKGSGDYDHELFLTDTAIEIIKRNMEDPTNESPFVFCGGTGNCLDIRPPALLLDKLYELEAIPLGIFGNREEKKPVTPHGMKATAVRGMYMCGAGDPSTIKLTTNASKSGDAIGSQQHYLPKNHVVTEDKKTQCLIIYEGWIRQGRGLPPRVYSSDEVFKNPDTGRPHVKFE